VDGSSFLNAELSAAVAAECFAALSTPARVELLAILLDAGAEGLTVGELRRRTAIRPSTLSHHLKTLREAGLMSQERRSTQRICRISDRRLHELVQFLSDGGLGMA